MSNKKDSIVSVRMCEEVKNLLEKYANKEKRSTSQFVYFLIEEFLLNNGECIPAYFTPEGDK